MTQAQPGFVRKARNKFDPLFIVPKQSGLLEVDPVLLGVGFAFAWSENMQTNYGRQFSPPERIA